MGGRDRSQEQKLDFSGYIWVCRFALETHTCHCNCQIKLIFKRFIIFKYVHVREKEGGNIGGREGERERCMDVFRGRRKHWVPWS